MLSKIGVPRDGPPSLGVKVYSFYSVSLQISEMVPRYYLRRPWSDI